MIKFNTWHNYAYAKKVDQQFAAWLSARWRAVEAM
jgi:hypothetical protein